MSNMDIIVKDTMTSLEIAEVTGKQHAHVLRDIRNMVASLNQSTSGSVDFSKDYHRGDRTQYKYLSEKTQDYILNFAFGSNDDSSKSPYAIKETQYKDAKGEMRTCYELNKKACFLLASGYDVLLRAKIINRWEELELAQMKSKIVLPDFTDPVAAARAWADSQEQCRIEQKRAEVAEQHVAILIHTNKTYTATEVGKECGFRSAQAFNAWLSEKGVQYKVNKTWVPTAEYANRAWFEIKQEENDFGYIIYHRKITGIGRDAIIELAQKDGLV